MLCVRGGAAVGFGKLYAAVGHTGELHSAPTCAARRTYPRPPLKPNTGDIEIEDPRGRQSFKPNVPVSVQREVYFKSPVSLAAIPCSCD